MEIASLAVGLPPLLSLCFEILDKVQSFRDYKSNSRQLSARFAAAKFRLQDWARDVGVVDDYVENEHHPQLDRDEVVVVVRTILTCLNETFGQAEETDRKLHVQQSKKQDAPAGWHIPRRSGTGFNRLGQTLYSTRAAASWVLKRKAVFTDQVDTFEILVDRLYEIVPPLSKEIRRSNSNSLSSPSEASVVLPTLKSLQTLQEEILLTVKQTRQSAMREAQEIIDVWLQAPVIDQEFEKHLGTRLDGTCDWIFDHQEYCLWEVDRFSDNHAKVLWISGPPGHGKTVLCANIAYQLQHYLPSPVAHFFSSPHVQAGCIPLDIIRSWLSQLCRGNHNIAFELIREKVMAEFTSRRGTEAEIWALFTEVVTQIECCTFIMDGFDEFPSQDEARPSFLSRLMKAVSGTLTRILVSSRPESDIESELSPREAKAGVLNLRCNIANSDIQSDILLYSQKVVSEQLPNKSRILQQELADHIASKCEGMFLWIKLQKPHLREGKSVARLRKSVESMPDGLTKTYGRTWDEIQSQSDDDRRRAIEILRWTCFALRPLTVVELTEALVHEYGATEYCQDDLPEEINRAYVDGEVKALCGSLIEVRPGADPENLSTHTVHLIHVSAKEFLITALPPPLPNPAISQMASISADDHMHLAEVCVRYLNCKQTWEGEESGDVMPPGKQFFKYAATGWSQHYTKASAISKELKHLTVDLFSAENKHFGQWAMFDDLDRASWTPRKVEEGQNARLYMAVRYELQHILEILYDTGIDFTPTTFACGSALEMAAWKSDSILERLIAWGADVNCQTGRFGSALGAAIVAGSLHKVKVLLQHGAHTNIPDSQGKSPVTLATEVDKLAILALLLEHGADPNDSSDVSNFALFQAIDQCNTEAVKLLLKYGASVGISNELGRTALHHACSRNPLEILRLLLENGADVSAKTIEGFTPLHTAALAGLPEHVSMLLEHHADPLVRTTNTGAAYPFHLAVESGSVETVQSFINAGVSPELNWRFGQTALWMAIEFQSSETVEILVEGGASLLNPVIFGRTPLEWIKFIWPDHEKLRQWEARAGLHVREEDRKFWLKRHICEVAQEMLDTSDDDQGYGFNDLGNCFKYLKLWDDATFAYQHDIASIEPDGTCEYRFVCNACEETLTNNRHSCYECPYVDLCDKCLSNLANLDEMTRCRKHEFLHVSCKKDLDPKRDLQPVLDPEVRTWLQTQIAKHTVEDSLPPLVPIETTKQQD